MASASGAGWAFMIMGLSLVGAGWVFPYAWRRFWLKENQIYATVYQRFVYDTELRMMVGFIMKCLGVAIFAGSAYARAIVLAGEAPRLTSFTSTTTLLLLLPSALLIAFGNAFILWDGYSARRGKFACVVLISLATVFWFTGNGIADYIIEARRF